MNDSVKIPVDLDIKLSENDFGAATKTVEQGIRGLEKQLSKIMNQVNFAPSMAPIKQYVTTVKQGLSSVRKEFADFQKEAERAGLSSDLYKEAYKNLSDYEARLKELEPILKSYKGTPTEKGDPSVSPEYLQTYKELKDEQERLTAAVREYKEVLKAPETAALSQEGEQVNRLDESFKRITTTLSDVNTQLSQPAKSQGYQELEQQATKLVSKLQEYNEKSKEMEQYAKHGIRVTDESWVKLQLSTQKTSSELDSVLRKMRALVKEGKALGAGTDISGLTSQIRSMDATRRNIAGRGQQLGAIANRAPIRLDEIESGEKSLQRFSNSADNANNSLKRLSERNKALSQLIGYLKNAAVGMAKLAKNVLTLGLASKKSSGSTAGLFKHLKRNLLMYGLGFRSAYYAIKRLRKNFIEGLTEMAKVSDTMNVRMSRFKESFNQLKGSIATAFQPLVSVAMPAITAFMNRLTALLEMIAKFNAVLTGQNYILKANANSIDVAADAQKGATKAAKDALGTYDKLNVISQDNDSGGDDSGGSLGVTYSEESIGGAASKFAQMVKDAWKEADFTEVGQTIAAKFVSALQSIPWGDIQETAKKLGKSVSSLINGVFSNEDLGKTIGETLANAAITAIDFMFYTFTNIDYTQIGKRVGEGIKAAFDKMLEIDPKTGLNAWQKLGKSLSDGANGILDMLYTALSTAPWDELGQGIADFISSIEWGKLTWNFAKLAWAILKGIAKSLESYTEKNPISGALLTVVLAAITGVGIVKKVTEITNLLSKLKGGIFGKSGNTTGETMESAGTKVDEVSTGTSNLTSKLKDLAKNLGWGILIIAEVAVAAGIIVGAIWGLGVLLEQVGKAWEPVIQNAGTIAIAIGIGTALLAAVGVVTALLGSVGKDLALQMLLGIGVLIELGIATGVFIAEIWAIGWGLQQVGEAWQPVLDNGETIATAIGIGTGLLVAIGVACALLGIASVASAGALPLAIGLGTAMLLELGIAAGLFITEIWAIGIGLQQIAAAWAPVLQYGATVETGITKGSELLLAIGAVCVVLGALEIATVGLLPVAVKLGTKMLEKLKDAFNSFCDGLSSMAKKLIKLAPILRELNTLIPNLKKDMKNFTKFMKEFGEAVIEYTKTSAISGLAGTIDKVIGFFTTDPIKKLNTDLSKRVTQFTNLINTLNKLIPKIIEATNLVGQYNSSMGSFSGAVGGKKSLLGSIMDGAKNSVNGVISLFQGMFNSIIQGLNYLIRSLNRVQINIPGWVPSIGGRRFGFNISQASTFSIPRLATGMVVPPNREFLSILGDNKKEPEVVSPLSTMKQAVREVLNELGGANNPPTVNLNLNGEQIAQAVWDEDVKRYKQTGKYGHAY